ARRWIVHNGEVYTHREVRADLGGAAFASHTDTETVLRGYAAWGDAVVPRLSGMFALALFEAGPPPRLLLVRDRFGMKPVYYYRSAERLVFASEVRALLRSGLVPDGVNPAAIVRYLQWGSVPSPLTTLRDVSSLPAGRPLLVPPSAPP